MIEIYARDYNGCDGRICERVLLPRLQQAIGGSACAAAADDDGEVEQCAVMSTKNDELTLTHAAIEKYCCDNANRQLMLVVSKPEYMIHDGSSLIVLLVELTRVRLRCCWLAVDINFQF